MAMEQRCCVSMVSGLSVIVPGEKNEKPERRAVLGVVYDPTKSPADIAGSLVYLVKGRAGGLVTVKAKDVSVA